MSTSIHVYTRPVDPDSYPEGLANSIHIAYSIDGGERKPLNRNYGIIFANGSVSEDNTIIPKGLINPGICIMPGGKVGITGERILEDGTADDSCAGKLLLWTTDDLIHFSDEEQIDRDEAARLGMSDSIEIDPAIAEAAVRYWSPIRYTGITLPEKAMIHSVQELDDISVTINYSDGSSRLKRVCWNSDDIRSDLPGTYEVKGTITQQSFRFPLADGYGDPVIFPWEGKWYYISTNDNLDDIGMYVREADDVDGLFAEGVTEHLILPFDPERGFEQTFWAPEFHIIGGELYILFAVSGHIWGPQCHMMKLKKGGHITDPDSWEDPVRVLKQDGSPLADEAITLDMTYVKAESGSYVIWSYRECIGTPLDSGSMLYIAPIDEHKPWMLTGEPVLLTRPLYGWENVSGTINNEGPHPFVRDGVVYVTYSGGSANAYTYALGLLTARTDADLCDPGSWTKSMMPVLTFYSVEGEYGPGHNSFYVNEDGEMMIAYHAETAIDDHLRCDGIRRVHFCKDGSPYFQMSKDDDIRSADVIMTIELK